MQEFQIRLTLSIITAQTLAVVAAEVAPVSKDCVCQMLFYTFMLEVEEKFCEFSCTFAQR